MSTYQQTTNPLRSCGHEQGAGELPAGDVNQARMHAIQMGDVVTWIDGAGIKCMAECVGWRDTAYGRYVLLGNACRQVSLDKVISRHRVAGAGQGVLTWA